MKVESNNHNETAFPGSDQMDQLIRAKNWKHTSIGQHGSWPVSFSSTLDTVLHSPFPMVLWWGPELLQFGNTAFAAGMNKQQSADEIGLKACESWPSESWAILGPAIEQALAGQPGLYKDICLPRQREGSMLNTYWTFSCSPVKDSSGQSNAVLGIFTETREKTDIAKKAAQENKRYYDMVMQAPMGVAILHGPDFVVEMANESYLPLVGKKAEEIIGRPLFESLPQIRPAIEPLLRKVLETGIPFRADEFEMPISRYGMGDKGYYNFICQDLRDVDGNTSGIMIIATEVTEVVNTRLLTLERERRYRQLIQNLPAAVYTCDTNGYIDIYNRSAVELWGFKPVTGETRWHDAWQIYFPDGRPIRIGDAPMTKAIRNESEVEGEELILERADGRRYNIILYSQPLKDGAGKISGAINMLIDITDRKITEQQLAESEIRLRLATEAAQLATWDLDLKNSSIIFSPRMSVIFGYDESVQLTHEQLQSHLHPDDVPVVKRAFDLAMRSGVYSYEARIVHDDKTVRWIKTQGRVIFNEQKEPLRMLGTLMDMTERQEAEEKIARTAAIVQFSDDAIISKTLEGIITGWNDAAERIFGYTADEMIGQDISRLIPQTLQQEEPEILNLIRSGKRVDHFETQRITKDSKILDISLTISPIKDLQGNIIGASKIARDITKQKHIEKLIKESEQKFRLLADSMPQLIWTAEKCGQLNYFNQSVYNYTGLSSDQVDVDGWIQNIHPDDREENTLRWRRAIVTGEDFMFELRFKRHDNQYRWHLCRAIPQKNSDGSIQMWVGTCTDIHDQKTFSQNLEQKVKERTRELNKEKQFAETILDSSVDNISVFDKDMRYLVLNKRAEEAYKIHKQDIIGKTIEEVFPNLLNGDFYNAVKAALTGETVHLVQYKSSLTSRNYEVFVVPLRTGKEVTAALAIAHDNTSVMDASLKAKKANEDLLKSNAELAQFAYVASHDLQEPLRKIQTFATRILELESKNLSETGKDYFDRMHSASKRMQQLIKDLISYSSANTAEKYFETADMNEILLYARESLKDMIEQKNARIQADKLPVATLIPFQIEQLFINILSNALKFSRPDVSPLIKITAGKVQGSEIDHPDADRKTTYHHIAISDNGIGFDPHFNERIFQVFQRLHGKQEFAGTGIGLAIVKKIVENHQGLITASSELGKGATFNIYIPV